MVVVVDGRGQWAYSDKWNMQVRNVPTKIRAWQHSTAHNIVIRFGYL